MMHATCQTLATLTANLHSLFYLSYSSEPVLNLHVFVQTFTWKENSLFWSGGLKICFYKVESFLCMLFLLQLITVPRPFAKPRQAFSYPYITPFYSRASTQLVVSASFIDFFLVVLLLAVVIMELIFL